MKVFYLDTETTGLNPKINDIIQLSFIIEIDGIIKEKQNFKMQPFNYSSITEEALKVNGITLEQLKTLETPQEVYKKLIKILDIHIDKYNKKDKFYSAGYNVRFDMDFLREFFIKNGDKYYGSYFDYHFIDAMPMLFLMEYAKKLNLSDHHLETACKHYGIEIKAHDAEQDIGATRELILKLAEYIK